MAAAAPAPRANGQALMTGLIRTAELWWQCYCLTRLALAATSDLTPLSDVTFGKPVLVAEAPWADGFYGLGPLGPRPRLVVGVVGTQELFSASGGAGEWRSDDCVGSVSVKSAFISNVSHPQDPTISIEMTGYGAFLPKLTPGQNGTNFTAPKPQIIRARPDGSLACTVAPGGAIRFVGLPPITSAKFSRGGLRFGGAASVYLGADGAHKFLQSVIVTQAGDGDATSVLAMGSADGKVFSYLGPIATASDFPSSQEGPNEHDLTWLPGHKAIVAVIRLDGGDGPRTHPYVNYHKSISTDFGLTWTRATPIDAGCARPRLLQMGSTMLLSGGRMRDASTSDVILWTSGDPQANTWAPYSLSAAHNAGEENATRRFDANVNSTSFSPRETNSVSASHPARPLWRNLGTNCPHIHRIDLPASRYISHTALIIAAVYVACEADGEHSPCHVRFDPGPASQRNQTRDRVRHVACGRERDDRSGGGEALRSRG
jgi:hypothetical protein